MDSNDANPPVGDPLAGSDRRHDGKAAGPKRRKGRRRFWWIVAIVLAVLVALVWTAPYLLSTAAGARIAADLISDRLKGTVRIEGLSLSWLGPCSVKGISLLDTQGREVLAAAEVTYSGGVWRALTDGERLGEIRVDSPTATLLLDEQWVPSSLIEAMTLLRPSAEVPPVAGEIILSDGAVTLVRPDGRSYQLSRIEVEVDLKTLDAITAEMTAQRPAGGVISATGSLEGLVSSGQIDLTGAKLSLAASTKRNVQLAPLLAFAGGPTSVGAGVGLRSVTATWENGPWQIHCDVALRQLRSLDWGDRVRPMGLSISGDATVDGGVITAVVQVTGQAGKLHAGNVHTEVHDLPWRQLLSWPVERVLAAVFAGEDLALPEFTVKANATIHLPALAAAVPSLLGVLPGVEITSGTVTASDLALHGGRLPSVAGRAVLEGLAARRDGETIRCAPASVYLAAAVVAQAGLQIDKASVRTGSSWVSADGPANRLQSQFNVKLATLQATLGKVFDLSFLPAEGTVAGTIDVTSAEADRLGLTFGVGSTDLRFRPGEDRPALREATFEGTGHVLLEGSRPAKLVVEKGALTLPDELDASVTGIYDFGSGGFEAKVAVHHGRVESLGRWAEMLGAHAGVGAGCAGVLVIHEASVTRADADSPVLSTGRGSVTGLLVDGKAVGPDDEVIALQWSDLAVGGDLKLREAKLESMSGSMAKVTATNVRWTFAEELPLTSHIVFSGDLAPCLAVAAPLAKWERVPPMAGRVDFTGDVEVQGGRIGLDGTGGVDDFRFGKGDVALRKQRLRVSLRGGVDRAAGRIDFEKLDVLDTAARSTLLSLDAGSSISDYRGKRVLDLHGSYNGSWADLMVLLHEYVPATAGRVELTGTTGGRFTITGPANQPELRPRFHSASAAAGVTWSGGRALQLPLGLAALSPTMADGQITLPATIIDAGGGKLRLGGVLDLRSKTRTLRLPGETKVLENVQLTPQLCNELLARVNPIFAGMVQVQGAVSLELTDLELPLAKDALKAGQGKGHLDLTAIRAQPAGLLGSLLQLTAPIHQGLVGLKIDGVDFEIRDGRVSYKNFTISPAPGIKLRFRGSVGFDDTMDLWVSMPVTVPLLRRFGVFGSLGDYVRVLSEVRVEVPIVGLRLAPRLDLSKVDVLALLRQAAQMLLAEKVGNILEGVFVPVPFTPIRIPIPFPTPDGGGILPLRPK